jgi:hypothetical protein
MRKRVNSRCKQVTEAFKRGIKPDNDLYFGVYSWYDYCELSNYYYVYVYGDNGKETCVRKSDGKVLPVWFSFKKNAYIENPYTNDAKLRVKVNNRWYYFNKDMELTLNKDEGIDFI